MVMSIAADPNTWTWIGSERNLDSLAAGDEGKDDDGTLDGRVTDRF